MPSQREDDQTSEPARRRADGAGTVSRAARACVRRLLRLTRHGTITIVEGDAEQTFGTPAGGGPAVRVTVRDDRAYRALLRGSLGLGEAYAARWFDCDDLAELARLAALNMFALDRWRRLARPLVAGPRSALGFRRRNTPRRARHQVAAHYDLGNDLFSLMLDETMTYSCAFFEDGTASLREAQVAKLERICRKLELRPSDHVLEIGTGWGGFAIHAASRHGCRVTTTTISVEQHRLATQRVREAGLGDRIRLLLADYRELSGTFDKLVSIEMIEAVGWQYLDTFFRRCSSLLSPQGAMLLQAITIYDGAYEAEKANRSFANTAIFPGGCLPSLQAISRSLRRVTDLRQISLEDISAHYVRTLRYWRENFLAQLEAVRALGYDRRFQRRWELYLAYCEGGFRSGRIGDVQLLLAKPRYRPLAAPGGRARHEAR